MRSLAAAFVGLASVLWGMTALAAPQPRAAVVAATYHEYSVTPPGEGTIHVCHGFGCKIVTSVALSGADRSQLAGIMAGGRGSAQAERQAIARAAAWFDRRVAPQTGTRNHMARAGLGETFDSDKQFDCIDSSRNMTSLLLLLEEYGLLKFHTPDVPAARGFLLDTRWPHATAVMAEKATGVQYAVDAWTRSYGQPAEIMRLARWMELR